DAHALEPLGRCARERGAEVDEAARLRVRLEAAVLILVERATRHDVPDGFLRVAGDDGLRARRHLVLDDVALELDDLSAGGSRVVDHAHRLPDIAFVVDPDLGDDERRVGRTHLAAGDNDLVHACLHQSASPSRSPCSIKPSDRFAAIHLRTAVKSFRTSAIRAEITWFAVAALCPSQGMKSLSPWTRYSAMRLGRTSITAIPCDCAIFLTRSL